jgi:hydroxymethylpyrimidine pyrophosphatase-like HAD family hydrolase
MNTLPFNHNIKLALADVDETIADVYMKASPEMIHELNTFIEEGRSLFMISGGSLPNIRERIADLLKPELRHRVLIAHCMGAEVWGFEKGGELQSKPYYSLYEGHFSEEQKVAWREIINTLIERFQFKVYPVQPKKEFILQTKADPLSVMLADRGPQITFEFINAVNLTLQQKEELEKKLHITIPMNHNTYDLRYVVAEEGDTLYKEAKLPLRMQLGGTMALDSLIEGVDKTKAVKYVLEHEEILNHIGLTSADISKVDAIEIWGDKYGQKKVGVDFHMCLAVSPKVRAIDFRDEELSDIPKGYNIQLWNGSKSLHDGLLEYLQSRHL